ncbi:HEPN domain-containing protein [Vulcanisaeta sp. JCM 16159]|uniref:HEPN domain-containing protein n=1 Tax=Vulcanisaeta sp. JCM 16159 TaxID=1295371 RepID=UPI0006D1B316|nr:HEPN domain-containing protein [Vulcanisaeta sp. JCM 16159]
MREEAIKELELARHLLEMGYLNYAVFHSYQAAEKALKALIIEKLRVLPPRTHNLLELANRLRNSSVIIDEVFDDLRD